MKDHIVAAFPPNKIYTRHSEGAFLRLKDGRILFVYSRFRENSSDDAPSDLVASFSADEGESWSEPVEIISAQRDYGVRNIMSVSLMRMQNGDVGLFYIVKATPSRNRIMLSRSNDEGKTFYRHTDCVPPERQSYYVLNNDRVIRLKSGRLVMPLAYHRGGYDQDAKPFFDGSATACFLLSDDDGETWRESRDTVFPPFHTTRSGLQEPGVVELNSGVVWAYFRTDQFRHYEAFSMNGGETWTKAQPSRFSGPNSPITIQRIDGAFYAVWNPVPVYNGRARGEHASYGGRTPLVMAVSPDGFSWPEIPSLVGNDPHCAYCYPSLFKTADGCMLVAYLACHDNGDHLYIRKIPL